MPAEWRPHEATWLAWPHNRDDWPGKIAAVYWVYAEIIRHLHQYELIRLIVPDSARENKRAVSCSERALRTFHGSSSTGSRPIAAGCVTAARCLS